VTLALWRAFDSIRSDAISRLTVVRLSARVGVVTARAVDDGWCTTVTGGRIADAGHMALTECCTCCDSAGLTDPSLAAVVIGAQVGIVTGGIVGFGRVGARSGSDITGPWKVTLAGGRAGHRVVANADAIETTVVQGAFVFITTENAIGFARVFTKSVGWVAGSFVYTGTRWVAHGRITDAGSRFAAVGECAWVGVITIKPFGFGCVFTDPCPGVAYTFFLARSWKDTGDWILTETTATKTPVELSAGVTIVASGPRSDLRVGAFSRARVANSGEMTLVRCSTHCGWARCTGSHLAGVVGGAAVPVIA